MRLRDHLGRILEQFVSDPSLRVGDVCLLGAEERAQLVVSWNDTSRVLDGEATAVEMFRAQAAAHPEAVALSWSGGVMTYAELDRRSERLADRLAALGAGPETVAGLFLERSPELVVGLLGVLKAGAAYLPLDPGHPDERLAFMLEDGGARLVLTRAGLAGRLPEGVSALSLDADWAQVEAAVAAARPQLLAENLAYVIYTSGSTGRPKGAMMLHGGLANYLAWAREAYGLKPGLGAPVNTPFSFDATVTSLLGPLVSGGYVELLAEGEGELAALGARLADPGGFGLVKLTPLHLEALQQLTPEAAHDGAAGAFVIGGEALTAGQVAFWRERAPGIRLINEYGPTEATVGSVIHEVSPETPHDGVVPVGRPIANMTVYVLDDRLEPVPVGVTGEVYIGGVGVCRGYAARPGLTADRFVPDPFGVPGSRLYRLGDLGRVRADGELEYLGRTDDQVKVRGYRIELGEVEAAISVCPGVAQAAVLARPDASGHRRLVAYVVGEGGAVDVAALRERLRTRLPEYMLPQAWMVLDGLPMTTNGKVDRRALPEPDAPSGADYVAPTTPAEETLCAIWADVLGLTRVGIHDNFFDLGGDSVQTIRMVSRARETFGTAVPLSLAFEAPTVSTLAVALALQGPLSLEGGEEELLAPLLPLRTAGE
ncbi:MAG: non-ribosomal peptide synthetase, partial [bacterium]